MSNPNFINLFSTPICTFSYPDNQALNKTLVESIHQLSNSSKSSDEYRSHQGGFYTPANLAHSTLPGMEQIQKLILENMKIYVDKVIDSGYGRKTVITKEMISLQIWAALTEEKAYQAPHLHAGANISGIYYVKIPSKPEPQGAIDLLNPLELQEMTFIPGAATTHCRVVPEAGMMLIFPAYVRHTVHPFFGDGERIIVVFNAMVTHGYGMTSNET